MHSGSREANEHSTAAEMSVRRAPGPSTRDRIVAAAVEALSTLSPADVLTSVGTRTIAKAAGVSPALVFHHFGSVEGLAEAVLERVFDVETVPLTAVTATIEAVTEATLPVDASMALHRNEFSRVRNDPELRLRLGMWAMGGASADRAYATYLARIDSRLEPLVARLLQTWGRELRPPWNLATYIAAHSSLLTSSVVRNIVDPDRSDRDVFARAAASLSLVSMRVQGDRHTVDDRLNEINYYPLTVGRRRITTESGRKRALLLHHAAEQFAIRGYRSTKLAQIARAARVSESTLYKLFVTKTALAAELFDKQAADTLSRIDRGNPGVGPAVLEALSKFTATHADTAPPFLSQLVDPSAVPTPTGVVGFVAGALPSTTPGSDRPTLLTIATIRRTLTYPSDKHGDVAAHVWGNYAGAPNDADGQQSPK